MEDQKNIHYRVGGKLTHCGVECLPGGKDIERIVIARIEYKESEVINGRTEQGVWVAHFAPNPYTQLPFILNATNRKRLVKRYPDCDGYLARLENVPVRLTKEKCRDVQDGGETWGLRISKLDPAPESSSAQPAAKKILPLDKVDAVANWAREKGKGLSDLEDLYELSADVREALIKALQGPSEDLPE